MITIDDAKDRKAEAEAEISIAMRNYEKETGLQISGIYFDYISESQGTGVICMPRLEVKI